MFHFPTFPPLTLCVQVRVTGHDSCRVSPFGNPRITARLTAPRGLSQPPTSFIGSWCQGIHRAPLLTWPQIVDARVHCAVLKIRVVPVPVLVACSRRSGSTRGGPPSLVRPRPRSRAVEGPEVRAMPVPSGPNSVPGRPCSLPSLPCRRSSCTHEVVCKICQIVNVPPLSKPSRNVRPRLALDTRADQRPANRVPGAP